jgi:hypothetical protein
MRKYVQSIRGAILLAGFLPLVSGCAHALVATNMNAYRVAGSTAQSTKKSIGVVPFSGSSNDQVILNGVADNLHRYSGDVVVAYAKGGERKVDVVANVDLHSQYDGSGINFLIDWPGFLIWTPAWNGYVYRIKHDFSVRLEDGKTDATIDTFNIPVELDIHHAAINRTWVSEAGGWIFWSVPAFIGGIVHTQYDPRVTPLEARECAAPVGDYVAQEIIRHIPAEPTTATAVKEAKPVESKTTLGDSLRELNKLKEDGLITQEEFDAKKKSLLEKY